MAICVKFDATNRTNEYCLMSVACDVESEAQWARSVYGQVLVSWSNEVSFTYATTTITRVVIDSGL